MWASRWKITIGRPRKTSSQSGYFFVFRDENRSGCGGGGRRPIVAGISRARIARTGHLFGGRGGGRGKLRNLIAAFITSSRPITYPASFFFMRPLLLRGASFFTRSDNNLPISAESSAIRDAVSLSSSLLRALRHN